MAEEKFKCAGCVFGGGGKRGAVRGGSCRRVRLGYGAMMGIKSAGLEMKQLQLLVLAAMGRRRLFPPQLPPQAIQLLLTKKPLKIDAVLPSYARTLVMKGISSQMLICLVLDPQRVVQGKWQNVMG